MLSLALEAGRPLRLLCLGAHSDDIEIGCGGAILSLLARHAEVHVAWVVFSAGAERAAEARASAAAFLAGATHADVTLHQFRDGFFPSQQAEIKSAFEQLKQSFSPDIVFTHYRDDRHQDHRVLSDLAWNTFRSHLILEYEILKYDGDLGQPNCFVAIEPEIGQQKIDLLMEHFGTQRSKHWFTPDTFWAMLRIRGVEANAPTRFAEAFYARKLVIE